MSKQELTDNIIKAWIIKGASPGYHESQKNLLKENWPTLYNAIEQLVIEDEYIRDMKAEAWDEGHWEGWQNATESLTTDMFGGVTPNPYREGAE